MTIKLQNPLLMLCGSVLLALAGLAQAGNGLNDVGYGSESAGMAGADLALARDTTALNTNPAGLTQIEGQVLDVLLEPYHFLSLGHRDAVGNDTHPDNNHGLGIGGGYARRINERLVVGVGSFFQGGAGFQYKHLKVPAAFGGGRDEFSSIFGSLKIAPGLAWAVSDQLSLGAAMGLLYSNARQKQFFETSTPNFSGARIDGLYGFSMNAKAGLQYRPTPQWLFALVYTSAAPITLENGEMRINTQGSGGGVLRYRDTEIRGLSFAREVGFGVRWQPSERWLWTAEANWLDWSSSMRETTLVARDANQPGVPDLVAKSPLNWRDQYLFAAGGTWRWTPQTELIFGASYAKQPIPKQGMSPTFALLGESSLSVGAIHRFGTHWHVIPSFTWQPPVELRYDSPVFGDSTDRWEATALYLTFSRRW